MISDHISCGVLQNFRRIRGHDRVRVYGSRCLRGLLEHSCKSRLAYANLVHLLIFFDLGSSMRRSIFAFETGSRSVTHLLGWYAFFLVFIMIIFTHFHR
jgi:hypothetical protein